MSNRSSNVAFATNVLRLGVCLPLAQCFNLTTNLMGQIAQNRCYSQCGLNRNLTLNKYKNGTN